MPRTAVLFADFQHDICSPGGRMVSQDRPVLERFATARGTAMGLLEWVRAQGPDVVVPAFVGHGFLPGHPELPDGAHNRLESAVTERGVFIRGEPGTAFVEELQPRPGERVFWKPAISPFVGTDLHGWLTRAGVSEVVVTGVVAHYVVLATAIGAVDRGFRVTVLSDCTASGSPELHEAAMTILRPLCTVTTGRAWIEAQAAG